MRSRRAARSLDADAEPGWEISVVTWGANVGVTITEAHRRDGAADSTERVLDAEEAKLRALIDYLAEVLGRAGWDAFASAPDAARAPGRGPARAASHTGPRA